MYRVRLSYDIPESKVAALVALFEKGIQLQGWQGLTLPAILEVLPSGCDDDSVKFKGAQSKNVLLTISEGKNQQVKRMFAAVGNRVLTLHRERIGDIQLDVKEGQWRYLTAIEIDLFNR